MVNIRFHGKAPYAVALLHGGPGAAGEMAPVARRLAANGLGVLEPLQTADSVDGQIDELAETLAQFARMPATLLGYSWGAWLALLTAARYPERVKKLILVSSGSLEEHYAQKTLGERLKRLAPKVRLEARRLLGLLDESSEPVEGNTLERLGEIFSRTDVFDPLPGAFEPVEVQMHIYQRVWGQAAELRRSGELLRCAALVQCPLTAIHGDFDPHPWQGVKEPLEKVLCSFEFVLLENCGHKPWIERQACEPFFIFLLKTIM
jgi:pimeloyl-ACP methyl ester carboxylesterase